MTRRLAVLRPTLRARAATAAIALTGVSCTAVDSTADREAARCEIADRIGGEPIAEPAADDHEFAAIAADGIELSECARVAVIARPEVSEAFARIGIARANRVQAGLLPNPSLTAGYLWTDGTGPDKRQFSFAQPIAEVFVMPNRIRASQLLLDAEIRRAAAIAVEAAAEARETWRRLRSRERALAIEDDGVALASRAVEIAGARLESGAISEFDLALARSRVAAAEVSRLEALGELEAARVAFAASLGRASSLEFVAVGDEPVLDAFEFSLARGLEEARHRRLDSHVAALELAAARFEVEREEGRFFLDARIGGGFEKVVDRLLGPIVTLTLPIFDQGTARIEAARAKVEVALARERTVLDRIGGEVRAAASHLENAVAIASHMRNIAVPIAEEVVVRAQSRFENGADDIDPWLEALGILLDRRRALARAEFAIADARSELERALGFWPIPE